MRSPPPRSPRGHFRDHMIAASLKPASPCRTWPTRWAFPRSYDRGLIEAPDRAPPAAPPPADFRDHMIAASLKPGQHSATFRDHMIAASLNRPRPPCCGAVLGHFRDHMIAASLKHDNLAID